MECSGSCGTASKEEEMVIERAGCACSKQAQEFAFEHWVNKPIADLHVHAQTGWGGAWMGWFTQDTTRWQWRSCEWALAEAVRERVARSLRVLGHAEDTRLLISAGEWGHGDAIDHVLSSSHVEACPNAHTDALVRTVFRPLSLGPAGICPVAGIYPVSASDHAPVVLQMPERPGLQLLRVAACCHAVSAAVRRHETCVFGEFLG